MEQPNSTASWLWDWTSDQAAAAFLRSSQRTASSLRAFDVLGEVDLAPLLAIDVEGPDGRSWAIWWITRRYQMVVPSLVRMIFSIQSRNSSAPPARKASRPIDSAFTSSSGSRLPIA